MRITNKARSDSYGGITKHVVALVAFDVVMAFAVLWLAFLLRFEGAHPPKFIAGIWLFSLLGPLLLVAIGWVFGLYQSMRRYTSLRELVQLSVVVAASTVAIVGINEAMYFVRDARPIPLSVPLIWSPILLLGLASFRVLPRLRQFLALRQSPVDAERVIIAGAGDAGEHLARDLIRHQHNKVIPVGFLDDDPTKWGKKIHGLTVLGPIHDAADAVAKVQADNVVVAIPAASSATMRRILQLIREAGAKVKVLPRLSELMDHEPTAADIRDVDIADLIGRTPVEINHNQIGSMFEGSTVLITGAAGSIGSVLARQALRFTPQTLLLLDTNETDLYMLSEELNALARSRSCDLQMLVADVRDADRIDQLFALHKPNIVLHAAAYKHVPVMELHPHEAVKTNLMGTRNVAISADRYSADRMILVSTDKAVQPTSVMGASKRAAEIALSVIAAESRTAFASVRFGNVLGSRGSVVPIFTEQIRRGGPITITDPDATRYFMTIEEATALICQAGALAKGGETFVLEMGEPVRILDLARRMRALLGNGNAEQIEIEITGLRGGEKLHEDLWQSGEVDLGIVQPGILKAAPAGMGRDIEELKNSIKALELLAASPVPAEHLKQELFDLATDTGTTNGYLVSDHALQPERSRSIG